MSTDTPTATDDDTTVVTSFTNKVIATSSFPVLAEQPARETDLCRCGHQRRAHREKRGRCYMETWPRHRCSCSLFKMQP